jgi:transcriptional regulator with XRE-family HTH domain
MPKRKFSDDLRRAIARSGKTRYQISAETGLAQSTLSKFVNGKGGLSVEGIDAICQSIGARLTVEGPAPRKKGK